MNSVLLNGVNAYPFISREQMLNFIVGKNNILIAVNAEKIINENDRLKAIINKNIGYPDGIGAVLAMKKKGYKAIKIPGVEFWLDIVRQNYIDKTFYLIGSSDIVIESTIDKLKKDFIGIQILGYHNGFLDENTKHKVRTEILRKKPDIIFVAIGTPKQEYLMDELIKKHPALYMGLGGSFDVYSGNVKRAPKIFQVLGLEWSYRLLKEPSRIFRQVVLLKYFIKLLKNEI